MRSVLSISLPKEISAELEAFARTTGRSKSDIVKESISIYLWESKFRKAQRKVGVKAKRIGIITEEDVFKAVS